MAFQKFNFRVLKVQLLQAKSSTFGKRKFNGIFIRPFLYVYTRVQLVEKTSAHRDVEAALLDLILDVAPARLAHVVKHFAQHPLQRVVRNLPTYINTRSRDRLIAVVTDVERRAIHMATILRGILIVTTQTLHVSLAAQDAGDHETMERHALHLKTVEETVPDVL